MIAQTETLEKLKRLLLDVFLIPESEFRFDLRRDEIDTWDSLGVVSLAVGVEEVFGYHMSQDEAMGISGIHDIVTLLQSRGVDFDG
jgi:acyl carrier protein